MNILVVEDEMKISRFIKEGLELEGHKVDMAWDGEDGIKKARENKYGVIVLDILLPKMNGFEVCKRVRDKRVETPILILTAKDTVDDRIRGLDAGADDYLVKPFKLDELLARLRAVARRGKNRIKGPVLQVGDLIMDTNKHRVERAGKLIDLSRKEYQLLHYMMRRPGVVCTRTMIGEHVWGVDKYYEHESNIIEAYIRHLRDKIDKGFPNKLIHTLHGAGYKLQNKDVNV